MIFGLITLLTALVISISAAVYSILGLTAIFAAAYWPIVILGGSLEFGKIVTTLWLHKYWLVAELRYKLYLSFAVIVLMVMTSMGVFGFLSKAHSDQAVPTGDIAAQIELVDTKLQTQKENINAARKVLSQMDGAVDQVLERSKNEQGARNANTLRQQQAKDRAKLADDIRKAQIEIAKLNEEKAVISKDLRKVEAEVGPIKYIAALIYGDNPDANVLERAVRWVIILIVIVFDPLAITLLLAATKGIGWEREKKKKKEEPKVDKAKYEEQLKNLAYENQALAQKNNNLVDKIDVVAKESRGVEQDYKDKIVQLMNAEAKIHELNEQLHQVAADPVDHTEINKKIAEYYAEMEPQYEPDNGPLTDEQVTQIKEAASKDLPIGKLKAKQELFGDIEPHGNLLQKHAMAAWKAENPGKTFKEYIDQFNQGLITELPWHHMDHIDKLNLSDRELITLKLGLEADNDPNSGELKGFGIEFPKVAIKGDMFLRVDNLPSVLYKFNGNNWIKVNKNLSDSYVYDDAYINHLIEKIESGEYDPDLLSDIERERILNKLNSTKDLG
jgi:predicted  nucleic acid-binding Zn-ribbon protein